MAWFNFFRKKPKSFLGIDIGASAVKVVEIEKKDKRHKLKNYAVYSLKEYLKRTNYRVGGESARVPSMEIAKAIKASMKEAEIEAKEAHLSVPVYSSFSTLMDLPKMSKEEIPSALQFEARKYIPVPISEVVLDWSIVSPLSQKPGYQVLVIAVPKKTIEYYNQTMKLAEMTSKSIEEETFSLSRALVGNDKSTIMLIDAGARSINVSIVDDGYIRITHNLELGGLKVTKAIAQQMDYDVEKAEEIKKGVSGVKSNNEHLTQIKGISRSILKVIVVEIEKIIDSYQKKRNRKVGKCIVVGSGAHLVGFIDCLKEGLSLDVSLGDPFARVDYPSILKPAIKELGPSLAVAVGLAMRD